MAKDPICGMTVDESSPLRAERDGQTYYFCSEHCRKKFVAAQTGVGEPATSVVTFHNQGRRFSEPRAARSFASRSRRGKCKTLSRGQILLPDVSGRGVG